jgi:uncharacterized membrane-anchored protein
MPQLRSVKISKDDLTAMSEVPAAKLGFWIIKILATKLGETARDTVNMLFVH